MSVLSKEYEGVQTGRKTWRQRELFRSQDTLGTSDCRHEPFCVYVFMLTTLKINATEIVNICSYQGTCKR